MLILAMPSRGTQHLHPHFLLILFPSFSLNASFSFAASFISVDQPLSGSNTIVSQGGNFVMGFFIPGDKSSQNYYMGIWYKKVSKFTPVWVANRETPISDPDSSEIRVSTDGNLVLINQHKTQIWSTNISSIPSNSTNIVEIQDTGNLVLRDGFKPSKVYWQSMDHPTDTWLPGGKLGRNKLTGERQIVTSWKNSNDPAPGIFSLEIDPNGSSQYFIYWNKTREFWTSGEWNGNIFTNVPEMLSHYIYNFEFVSNDNTSYFTYSLQDDTVISRFIMDISGQIKQLTWVEGYQQWILFWSQPKQQCDVYALCGPFGVCNERSFAFCSCVQGFSEASPTDWELNDHSRGCRRNAPLQCATNSSANGPKDGFFPMPGASSVDTPHSLPAATVEDCELACLRNCSCTAYSHGITGCSMWYGDLLSLQQKSDGSSGETLYLRLAASELSQHSESKEGEMKWVVLGSVLGSLACLAIVFTLVWVYRRRKRMATATTSISTITEGNLMVFRYSELQRMTKNFSEKLGGGSFGSVYKGMLPAGSTIAVKKLEGLVCVGEKQFRNEVSTVGSTHHVNLVRLRGFCSQGDHRLLAYDYMPKGSLGEQLFRNSSSMVLDWNKRYQIALGAARGLAYLHDNCRDRIIHCDIKPENILLDESFVPKVADFGLAKLLGRDYSRVLTTMRGTIGYLAPEWISGVAITAKADVYSYGMVLLEIISGTRNMQQCEEGRTSCFPLLAANRVNERDVVSLLDHRLQGDANLEELDRACKVACWCIQDNEVDRPSMGQVVQILEGVIQVDMPPIPRSLQLFAESPETMVFFSDSSSGQANLPNGK
ncbi:G-type lectin S-receptor-like serine/threonine-protein kinase At2g19130 [Typha angustifolia]|uniref:G-type lectin S-receptor-like serine/threonine-protein kinase At2g19130 n=1 Tax=Typha angustifolia TaxID=59011 RepID=UPI003C2EB8DF